MFFWELVFRDRKEGGDSQKTLCLLALVCVCVCVCVRRRGGVEVRHGHTG
jgi:hypothetical protein